MLSESRRAGDGEPVQVQSDGTTVWVHGTDGTVGRFGPLGIDVHTADTSGCLHCTHGPTYFGDWIIFVHKMREHHGVAVGPHHRPERFGRAVGGAKA